MRWGKLTIRYQLTPALPLTATGLDVGLEPDSCSKKNEEKCVTTWPETYGRSAREIGGDRGGDRGGGDRGQLPNSETYLTQTAILSTRVVDPSALISTPYQPSRTPNGQTQMKNPCQRNS